MCPARASTCCRRRGGRLDVAAQQVDLGAGIVHRPVIAVRAARRQRVDQRRGLGRAPAGQQRLGCVGGQDGDRHEACQAGLAGRPAARCSATSAAFWNLASLEQRVAFVHGQPHQGRAVPGGLGQGPRPVEEGESLLDLPAQERVVSREAGQDAGDQGRGAGRFGDLQRPGAAAGRCLPAVPRRAAGRCWRSRTRPRRDRLTAEPARTAAAPPRSAAARRRRVSIAR